MSHDVRDAQHPHSIPGRGWYTHGEYIKELSLAASVMHILYYNREYSGLFISLLESELEQIKELDEESCPVCVHAKFRFKVVEHFNGYELLDTLTNKTAWLGDGVDVITLSNGKVMSPGTAKFIIHWEWHLNLSPASTLAAYFPGKED